MSMATGFLTGAKDRLLPASVPFRFFIAASLFHILAWAALFWGADQVPGFAGGTGPVLAAIHLLTLGVFAMTAIGASYQLLPVATRKPLARTWPTRLSFWLFLPGVAILTAGMALHENAWMMTGAVAACAGLAVFALLTADNLRRAGSVPIVAAHGWAALAALVALAAIGLTLIEDFRAGFLPRHGDLATLHLVLASYGFMGMLVFGFSLVLVPMFVLSRSLPTRPGWAQLGLAVAALVLFSAAYALHGGVLAWLAFAAALGATGAHLWLMRAALRSSMRRRLGLPFVQIRSAWGFLALSLVLGGLLLAGVPVPNGAALFGFVLLAGWLLTFLTGVLQRIIPFLASMHAAGKSGLPPLLSELTAENALKTHSVCHFAALAVCAAGILLDLPVVIRVGAAIGVVGAVGFAVFTITVAVKIARRHHRAA
ncbi:MAG: hypothetical protein KDK02_08270 [Rhodobacteraceae bacterium]|nr:hypothetical protein [Paracoccaceae bacterium]